MLQLFYKSIWLLGVALPLWKANNLEDPVAKELTSIFIFAVVLDLLVIPWGYVISNFVMKAKN